MSGATPGGSPSDQCDVVHLRTSPSTPDMLIVLDRSGSMGDEGRWQPSVSAVRTIVMQLQSQIRFGLALFPDPEMVGNNNGTSVSVDISKCFSDPDSGHVHDGTCSPTPASTSTPPWARCARRARSSCRSRSTTLRPSTRR